MTLPEMHQTLGKVLSLITRYINKGKGKGKVPVLN